MMRYLALLQIIGLLACLFLLFCYLIVGFACNNCLNQLTIFVCNGQYTPMSISAKVMSKQSLPRCILLLYFSELGERTYLRIIKSYAQIDNNDNIRQNLIEVKNLKQKIIKRMISQQMQRTPKINKFIESTDRVVTSLGLYSNKKLQSDSKSSNSAKSIQQPTKSKMEMRNQNQQDNKYTKPTKYLKNNNNCAHVDCDKSIDGYIVEEFQISSNNNQGSRKNIGNKKQKAQNIEMDMFTNNYSVNTNPKSSGNVQQKNNQTQDPKQRQYQIMSNKSKSNIVYLQSQLKQMLKLNLLAECAEQQKQMRASITKLELQVRRMKLEMNEKKKQDLKMKENYKKMQELRFLCSQQKIISNQLNIRQIQTEELLSKHKLYVDSMTIIFDQKLRQRERIRQKQQEEIQKQREQINYLYYQGELESVNRSSIKQNSMEMAQSYRYGEITEVDSQSQTYSDKLIKNNAKTNGRQKSKEKKSNIISSVRIGQTLKNDRKCRSRIKKSVSKVNILKLTDNSDNVSKDEPVSMSEMSQIIHSSQGMKNISYTANQDMVMDAKDRDQYQSYYEPNLTHTNTFDYTTRTINLYRANNKKKQTQYKKLLEERVKILKSNIKFIKEDNQKKEKFLTQQKLCIKKNIELFKLDTITVEQENRKLNKIYFRKKMSSLSNSHEGGYRSNNNIRYKLLRSNQGRNSVTNSVSTKSKPSKFRLKMRTGRSQQNEAQQSASKLLYWNSYKQYQISTDRTLSGSSHKNIPITKYTLSRPQPRLSPKMSEYRMSNIYTSRNIQTHALIYGSKPVYGQERAENYLINCQQTPKNNKIFVSSLHDEYYN